MSSLDRYPFRGFLRELFGEIQKCKKTQCLASPKSFILLQGLFYRGSTLCSLPQDAYTLYHKMNGMLTLSLHLQHLEMFAGDPIRYICRSILWYCFHLEAPVLDISWFLIFERYCGHNLESNQLQFDKSFSQWKIELLRRKIIDISTWRIPSHSFLANLLIFGYLRIADFLWSFHMGDGKKLPIPWNLTMFWLVLN